MNKLHSVSLNNELCVGCTNCIKGCPTEAIRVRHGKAVIDDIRCVDCSECIRICPYHAKIALTDPFDSTLETIKGKLKVAVVSPVLFTQFPHKSSRSKIMSAIISLGFDYVFDESIGSDSYLQGTREIIGQKTKTFETSSEEDRKLIFPLISSSCPVIVRFIQMKYRTLIPRLVSLETPFEITARYARSVLSKQSKVEPREIAVVYFSPCPSKKTHTMTPLGTEKSNVDFVIGIHDVYSRLVRILDKRVFSESDANMSSHIFLSNDEGIRCAVLGGEAAATGIDNFLTVDGINNVSKIMDEIEADHLPGISFVEPTCCFGGCVGGPLTISNRFAATARLREFAGETFNSWDTDVTLIAADDLPKAERWSIPLMENNAMQLSDDIGDAMSKYDQIDKILATLPGLDCGACGSPSCASMAEDIVQGKAIIEDCIIMRNGSK